MMPTQGLIIHHSKHDRLHPNRRRRNIVQGLRDAARAMQAVGRTFEADQLNHKANLAEKGAGHERAI